MLHTQKKKKTVDLDPQWACHVGVAYWRTLHVGCGPRGAWQQSDEGRWEPVLCPSLTPRAPRDETTASACTNTLC